MFYYKTNFAFSDQAIFWIKNKYKNKFDSKFCHDLDMSQAKLSIQQQWQLSPAGVELVSFLKQFDLDIKYLGIGLFMSNQDEWYEGNPHIDIKFSSGVDRPIRARFNVLVLGNPEDDMIWWGSYTYDSDNLVLNKFKTIDGHEFTSRSIPGNSPRERWEHLGTPTERVKNLLTPSAFVKTDCVHTVNVSPGPRLIVSVAFKESFEEIVERVKSKTL